MAGALLYLVDRFLKIVAEEMGASVSSFMITHPFQEQ
jgi:hypothetical protein